MEDIKKQLYRITFKINNRITGVSSVLNRKPQIIIVMLALNGDNNYAKINEFFICILSVNQLRGLDGRYHIQSILFSYARRALYNQKGKY